MFNNPFTPESKKAKKSLFNKKIEKNFYASKVLEEKIADPLVEYGPFKLAMSQVKFLNDLVRMFLKHAKSRGINSDPEKLKKDLITVLESQPKVTQLGQLLEKYSRRKNRNIDENGYITRLDFKHWTLEELPESIVNLKNLGELYISRAGLRIFPEQLTQLKNLWDLDISDNYFIPDIPENIGEMTSLVNLKIDGTAIQTLPESFLQLKKLLNLKLNYNFKERGEKQVRQLKAALPKVKISFS